MTELAEKLTEMTGVPFVRDVWVSQPEGNYGTVAMAADNILWGDNKPIKRRTTYNVQLFTPTSADEVAATVEAALTALDGMRRWTLTACELLTDPVLMRRQWQLVMDGVI